MSNYWMIWASAERVKYNSANALFNATLMHCCSDYIILFEGRKVTFSTLCIQSFLNENACSGDESSASKVLFEHPSTTFVHTKT